MTRARSNKAAGTVLLLALTLAGCGQGGPAVTASASAILSADVQRLQAAARSGSAAQIARAGDQLRADLAAQRATGQISRARATAVLDQLSRVLADAAATLPTAASTATPPSEPSSGGSSGDQGDGGDGG